MNRDDFSPLLKAQVAALPHVPVQLLVEMNLLACSAQLDVAMSEFDFSSMAKASINLTICLSDANIIGAIDFKRARETADLLDGTAAKTETSKWMGRMGRCDCPTCDELRGMVGSKVKVVAADQIRAAFGRKE